MRDVRRAAWFLWMMPLAAALSSRFTAKRTAACVSSALASAAVTVDSALREMSFGTWEGHTVAELRESVGAAFIAAENKGLDFQPPGGESPRAAMARIGRWTASLAAAGQPVVAVSHKATIRALLALATGWDMMGRPPHKLDWRCLHFFSAHADGRVSVDRLNVPL